MTEYRSRWQDEELESFRGTVRRFVTGELAPREPAWQQAHRVDAATWREVGAMGLLLCAVPEAYGGSGGTIAHVGRVFIDSCIERYLAGTLDTETASMAKWWLTDMQCQVIDECLQLFGGYGYMREYPIAQMYADARVQRIYGGSNEIMKEIIARTL